MGAKSWRGTIGALRSGWMNALAGGLRSAWDGQWVCEWMREADIRGTWEDIWMGLLLRG